MSNPISGSVPPPPADDDGGAQAPRHVISNDDIPTAPFEAVPADAFAAEPAPLPPAPSLPAPLPPVPAPPAATTPPTPPAPVQQPPLPAAPPTVQRVSAIRRTRPAAPASPFAAAAPLPAPPPQRGAYPPMPASDQGDWFGQAAAQQQAAPAPDPGGYAPPAYAPPAFTPGGAPAVQSGYPQPGYTQPGYPQTGYEQPGYAQPGYQQPGYPQGDEVPPESPRRSPAARAAFAVLGVVVLVGVVAFAWNQLTRPGADDEAGPATAATGQQSQSPSPDATAAAGEVLKAFASPTGNITCEITATEASCGIAQLAQQPAPVEGCDGTTGYRVTLNAETGKVELPCVPTDEQPQKAAADAAILDYGQSVTQGPFTCTSTEQGMTCEVSTSGRSFTIRRAGIGVQ